MPEFDLAIVGGGIIGVATAILAARAGCAVILCEADPAPLGASIRNFGLVTVTGQKRGDVWSLSMRSRDLWERIAQEAGLPVVQRGMIVAAQSSEAAEVLKAFAATEMGEHCTLLSGAAARERSPLLREDRIEAALLSPHELRVEPRSTLTRLVEHARGLGVDLRFNTAVVDVAPGEITTIGKERIRAQKVLVCTGARLGDFMAATPARRPLTVTKLHMMRIDPGPRAAALRVPAISDLTLVRYAGFSTLPESDTLHQRLREEQSEMLADGIHIIAVRNDDGTLVIGDSHHPCDGPAADPFQPDEVDLRIMRAAASFLDLGDARVVERWTGAYPLDSEGDWLIDEVHDGVWRAGVLGGKGMTLSFGFAEKVLVQCGLIEPICLQA
jgi:D-hydroxyproline dehydrogenase subunit beta